MRRAFAGLAVVALLAPVALAPAAAAPAADPPALDEAERARIRAEADAATHEGEKHLQEMQSVAGADERAALDSFLRAEELWSRLGDSKELAWAIIAVGDTYVGLRTLDVAAADYERALALGDRLADAEIRGNALAGIGLAEWLLGEPERALERFAAAAPLLAAVEDDQGERMARSHQALVLAALGRYPEAEALRRALLAQATASGDRAAEAAELQQIGAIALAAGEPRRAVEALERALAIRAELPTKRPGPPMSLTLARLLQSLGEALAAAGDRAQAAQRFAEALDLRLRIADAPGESETRLARARFLRDGGDLHAALDDAARAVEILEREESQVGDLERRATFRATNRDTFVTWIDVLLGLDELEPGTGRDAQAFEASERWRARSLRELVERGEPGGEAAAGPISLAAIQSGVLDAESLLLSYCLGERRSYLFAVSAGDLRIFRLPPRATIEALARRAYELTAESELRTRRYDAERAAAELSRLVLAPVAAELAGRRLLIEGDGVLQYVPFAALPDPSAPGALLVERHEIVLVPSAATVAALRARSRPAAPRSAAILADPVFSVTDPRVRQRAASDPRVSRRAAGDPRVSQRAAGDLVRSASDVGLAGFDRLPFTRREAEEIGKLAPDALSALGFAATRELALSPALADFRIVHFATHGVVDSRRPERSGLVLSLVDEHGVARDGYLRVPEIAGLELRSDLVVLSACRTALGREVWGEGLVGLARGFMAAGSPRVVATLWNVRDEASAEWMRRFYGGLLRDGLRPAAALRQAQLAMRADPRWRAPYYWAGFVLQGEWR